MIVWHQDYSVNTATLSTQNFLLALIWDVEGSYSFVDLTYGKNSGLQLLYWNTKKSEGSIFAEFIWQICLQCYCSITIQGHTQFAHHTGHLQFFMDSVATSTLQFWSCTIRLSPVLPLSKMTRHSMFHQSPVWQNLIFQNFHYFN
jgi:hypothetical protein